MNVLIMGGTQFNGLALVHELARTGHHVTILNRGKTEAHIPLGVQRLFADRNEPESVRTALADTQFDCVFDMTAYRLADVELMTDIFRGRVGHFVFIGSTVIYDEAQVLPITENYLVDRGERQNEYGLNKLLCEDFLIAEQRRSGFPATVVSLSMGFGPRNILPDREQRMFARLLQQRPILIPGDGQRLGQVGHVDDQARAMRMLMGQPQTFGKRYNLTGADAYTAEGYVDTFARILGVEAHKVFIPASLMDDLWDGRRSVEPMAANTKIDTRLTARSDDTSRVRGQLSFLIAHTAPNINRWNRSVVYSIDRLRRDVGWEPEYTFAAAVEQTYAWFRREGLNKTVTFDFGFEDQLLQLVDEWHDEHAD
jgi:dTDP-glucose 4,6-dehydratase